MGVFLKGGGLCGPGYCSNNECPGDPACSCGLVCCGDTCPSAPPPIMLPPPPGGGAPPPPSPPPPSPRPATLTTVTITLASGPLFVGSTAQLTVRVITNGAVSILFRTNRVPAPTGGSAVVRASPTEAIAASAEQDGSAIGDDGSEVIGADVAASAATDGGSNAAQCVEYAAQGVEYAAQGGRVTTQWWLFPPFGPKFKSTPILYSPNPLVVSRSGFYTVSVVFQKAGIYKIDAVNARSGRLVTQRALLVKVRVEAGGLQGNCAMRPSLNRSWQRCSLLPAPACVRVTEVWWNLV